MKTEISQPDQTDILGIFSTCIKRLYAQYMHFDRFPLASPLLF